MFFATWACFWSHQYFSIETVSILVNTLHSSRHCCCVFAVKVKRSFIKFIINVFFFSFPALSGEVVSYTKCERCWVSWLLSKRLGANTFIISCVILNMVVTRRVFVTFVKVTIFSRLLPTLPTKRLSIIHNWLSLVPLEVSIQG